MEKPAVRFYCAWFVFAAALLVPVAAAAQSLSFAVTSAKPLGGDPKPCPQFRLTASAAQLRIDVKV